MKRNRWTLVILLSTVVLMIAAFAALKLLGIKKQCNQFNHTACVIKTNLPIYKMTTSYSNQAGGFQCSKSIKVISTSIDQNGQPTDFSPVDPDEGRLFCHMTYAIEYKGKLTVLQRPEVLELINHYQYKDVSIKALEFKYIQDKKFVHRLLPQYTGREIGCIIVLERPNEKLVYLEDEDLNTFEQMDYKTFMQDLDNISREDRELFLNNLK